MNNRAIGTTGTSLNYANKLLLTSVNEIVMQAVIRSLRRLK